MIRFLIRTLSLILLLVLHVYKKDSTLNVTSFSPVLYINFIYFCFSILYILKSIGLLYISFHSFRYPLKHTSLLYRDSTMNLFLNFAYLSQYTYRHPSRQVRVLGHPCFGSILVPTVNGLVSLSPLDSPLFQQ